MTARLRHHPAMTHRTTLLPAFTFALACATCAFAHAVQLPQQRLSPGGVAELPLGPSATAPKVTFNGSPVMVVPAAKGWTAVVGIPLSAKPGTAGVKVQQGDAPANTLPIKVLPYHYAEQRLTVAPGQVDLSKEDLARYERERDHLAAVIATFSDPVPASLLLRAPVPGPRSSSLDRKSVV